MAQKSLIKLEGINKSYGKGKAATHVLKNVKLNIKEGEFVAIMGASGSGKTTLMNIIGLLDRPDTGSYHFDGLHTNPLKDRALAKMRSRQFGFVFQNFNLLGRMSARANVELPMVYARLKRKLRKERSIKLLKLVRLERRIKYKPTQLSGGEMQRVAIARALANGPRVLLADEPTGNLDSKTGELIMRILKRLNQKGTTVIVVTHDQKISSQTKRTIHIKDGRVTRGGRK